jgi:hypothetical protein
MLRMACIGFVAAAIFSVAVSSPARMSKSVSYEFEYTSSGLGGGTSQAADYGLVGKVSEMGGAQRASSASYSLEPVVGSSVTPSSVIEWEAY